MAWTAAQIAALEAAIATGALTVRYADRTVTYRSLDEMLRLLEDMKDEVLARTKVRHIRVNSSKGFSC